MKSSTYNLITELCSSFSSDYNSNLNKDVLNKKIRSRAFEILLSPSSRTLVETNEFEENNTDMLVVDISGHIYSSSKARGEWSEELKETMRDVLNNLERLVESDPWIVPVLKLLLRLADSSPLNANKKEKSYGLDMKTLITERNGVLKHRPLLLSPSTFNSEIFELPALSERKSVLDFSSGSISEFLGSGLRHQEFFSIPESSSRCNLKDIEENDVINNSWISKWLHNANNDVSSSRNCSRSVSHQDEGYVTPDQDLRIVEEQPPYIPWERMYETPQIKPVYSWECQGSVFTGKRQGNPYISHERSATEHIWKVVHAHKVMSSLDKKSIIVVLKAVSLEELEIALKNLLLGVESNMFHFNHERDTFELQEGLYLTSLAAESLREYCEDFIECANSFLVLNNVVKETFDSKTADKCGVIYKVFCSNLRRYQQCYRLAVLHMPGLRTTGLLHTHQWLQGLRAQLKFLSGLCPVQRRSRGGAWLAELYDQGARVVQPDLCFMLFYILQSCCTVYFEFLKKWIFEGDCNDKHKDFFIESCPMTDMKWSRWFWVRGFMLQRMLIPSFLRGLESDILVCGKSMALLKLCASDDPVCVEVGAGYPGVVCCLAQSQLTEVTAQCHDFEERVQTRCRRMFGETSPEPQQDQDYYATLRAKTFAKIKQVQEEEQRLRSEKKRIEFDILKKNMEEAALRKLEDKKNQMEEEQRLLEEAQEVDKLNDLRREEEREKLVHYYSAVSEAADRRREKAEWKIKRAELHDKRVVFFKEDQLKILEDGNFRNDLSSITAINTDSNCIKLKVEESAIPGSGDHVDGLSAGHDSADEAPQQLKELVSRPSKDQVVSESTINHESKLDIKDEPFHAKLKSEKRDWLIALDVADKARQSAALFKERNMFNDYNILTGEVKTYKSRFGKEKTEEIEESLQIIAEMGTSCVKSEGGDTIESELSTSLRNCELKTEEAQDCSGDVAQANIASNTPVESPFKSTSVAETENSPACTKTDFCVDRLKVVFDPKKDLNVDEIDMRTIHQNLKMSVMIPLSTQLRLANEAVLRLFLVRHKLVKHLECIRKYFFLMDGEFCRNLTKSLFTEIQTVEHPSYLLNVPKLNTLLRMAVGPSSDEELTERLSFFVKSIPPVFRLIDPNTLDCLSLRYRTYWPLNVFITDGAIVNYDKVFTFLLQLQRTSWALEQDAYLLKDKRLFNSTQYRQIQLHRHIMTHFVMSLKNYVMTVVLEELWFEMVEKFKKGTTLNELYAAHVKYLKDLLFGCLLNKRSHKVQEHLVDLLAIILRFHEVLRGGEWVEDPRSGSFTHSGAAHLAHLYQSFLQQAQFLYQYLQRLVSYGYQPHMAQLLTVLSANDFYEKKV